MLLQATALWFLNLAARHIATTPLMYLSATLPILIGLPLVLLGHELGQRLRQRAAVARFA